MNDKRGTRTSKVGWMDGVQTRRGICVGGMSGRDYTMVEYGGWEDEELGRGRDEDGWWDGGSKNVGDGTIVNGRNAKERQEIKGCKSGWESVYLSVCVSL